MDRPNRTWLCTVVFLDVVRYTERTVAQQMRVHQHLKDLIGRYVKHVSEDDRVLVDTGDGAAVCFLLDPEEALFFALNVREALVSSAREGQIDYQCRIGINLGPVKIIRDVNGRRNALGDGINIAQRVMDFAGPNQLLVSRPYFELLGCLSDESAQLFSYLGVRRDKHIKEHEIYEVTAAATADVLSGAGASQTLPPATGVPSWDGDLLDSLAKDLAEYLGPLARVLVRREAGRAGDCEQLIRVLAESITDADEREHFLERVSAHDAGLGSPSADTQPPIEGEADAAVGLTLADGELAALSQRLAASLGPIAKVLVKRSARRAASYAELVRILAAEIPEGPQRERFLRGL